MPLSNSQYGSIIRLYEEKQRKNRHDLEERRQYVSTLIEGYEELESSISSISVSQGKKLLNGDSTALAELKHTLAELSDCKAKLLGAHGLSPDYLSPSYECPDCQDTGYIHNQKCHCFKQAIINLLYDQSNLKDQLQNDCFENLSYEYYKDEDLTRFQNAVRTSQTFINEFEKDFHNLFFYGTVGTGKSFLSGCISKSLLDKGYSVIYFSSAGLFELLAKNSFDYRNKEELTDLYDDLYNCDLLIIDDLGTELTTTFASSQLFSCLNERLLRKKSLIISTNLSLEELRDRYSDRIFSRITSNFQLCKLTGPDIRMNKKRLLNRK